MSAQSESWIDPPLLGLGESWPGSRLCLLSVYRLHLACAPTTRVHSSESVGVMMHCCSECCSHQASLHALWISLHQISILQTPELITIKWEFLSEDTLQWPAVRVCRQEHCRARASQILTRPGRDLAQSNVFSLEQWITHWPGCGLAWRLITISAPSWRRDSLDTICS